jgi:hypothetical protein
MKGHEEHTVNGDGRFGGTINVDSDRQLGGQLIRGYFAKLFKGHARDVSPSIIQPIKGNAMSGNGDKRPRTRVNGVNF